MKLTFLGTRGQIQARTRRHRMHTSLLVTAGRHRVMIDAGTDWTGRLDEVGPDALVLTHAHADHAEALREGAPCPVWATEATWRAVEGYPAPPRERREVKARTPFEPIPGVVFEAFPVEHSIRAPAVGYRIGDGRRTIFYVPDVARIPNRTEALAGVDLYVGDGATLETTLVRREGGATVGHAPVARQLAWCARAGVPRVLVTHCGAEIVEGDERRLGARLRSLGRSAGVEAAFAHDGLQRVLR